MHAAFLHQLPALPSLCRQIPAACLCNLQHAASGGCTTAPLSFQGKDRLKFWDLTAATALYLQGGDLAGTGGFHQPSLGLLGINCVNFPWAYCKSWKCPRSWQKCPCALWHCPVFLAVPFGQLFLGNAAICSPLIPDTQWEVKGKFLICVWPLGVLAGVL